MGAESGRAESRLAPPGPATIAEGALGAALAGRYAIESEVAHGAMGTVLRARDLRHDRPVALKVLRPELATSVSADRFLREVHTAAGLTHPNIVAVHDSGEAAGLLYYVMQFIEGEALSDRLARAGPLGVAEALRVTREVAEALAFAHARGVIHRDIKPANILLAAHGHALVTDFGIARAVSDAADAHLTRTGAVMGSPLYVSPEQAAGAAPDGRADVYSLGCVLYEMLCGRPPFQAPTLLGLLGAHLSENARSPCLLRPDVPAAVEQLVLQMLRKVPAERCEAVQLLAELDALAAGASSAGDIVAGAPGGTGDVARRPRSQQRLWFLVGGAIVAVAALAGVRLGLVPDFPPMAAAPDSTRYAVLPFRRDPGSPAGLDPADRLRDALLRWHGIEVIDAGDAGVRLSRADSAGVGHARARKLARAAGAGRFVAGRISRDGDSLRIYAELGDAIAGARAPPRAQVRLAVPARLANLGGTFNALADSLALAGLRADCVQGSAGTQSLRAVRACDAAFAALDQGDLPATDSLFRLALGADPRYARAALWLVQARGWLAERAPPSPELMAVANAGRTTLPSRERSLLDGLQLMNAGGYSEACAAYASLTAADSLDVAAWLGMGECHRRDDIVIPDRRSPSGWAFRSSYERAVQAYRRAFEIRPQLMSGFNAHGFEPLRRVLFTSTTLMRPGRTAAPETLRLSARPDLSGDTVRFTPFPVAIFSRARPATHPAGLSLAVDRQRRIFRDLAIRWSSGDMHSAAAQEAVALSLDLMGDPAAVAAIATARALAQRPSERVRLAQEQVLLRVKFGLPDRVQQLESARILADSLLGAPPQSAGAADLIGLALLLGHARQAAALARVDAQGGAEGQHLPSGVVADAGALLAFASVAAPRDSVRLLAERVEQGIRNSVAPQEQQRVREDLLRYPAVLVFPADSLPGTGAVLLAAGYLGEAILASARGDTAGMLRVLQRIDSSRAYARPADLSIDGIFVESTLLARCGHTAEASDRLAATLDAARWFPPLFAQNAARAGTLLRAMVLRADLAARQGDEKTAARWARAVVALWADPDPELRPIVARMRGYSAGPPP